MDYERLLVKYDPAVNADLYARCTVMPAVCLLAISAIVCGMALSILSAIFDSFVASIPVPPPTLPFYAAVGALGVFGMAESAWWATNAWRSEKPGIRASVKARRLRRAVPGPGAYRFALVCSVVAASGSALLAWDAGGNETSYWIGGGVGLVPPVLAYFLLRLRPAPASP
ncbi:MAG: hypothetical protein JWM90_2163 [Thermoleophilia bacterium]|nr:hypothetical protein [Thermoleophilia bacterium]